MYDRKEYKRKYDLAHREQYRKHYQENRESILEKHRIYIKRNKEIIRKRSKKYHNTHKEERNKYSRKYNKENKEKINTQKRKYYRKNIEHKREYYRSYNMKNAKRKLEIMKRHFKKYGKSYNMNSMEYSYALIHWSKTIKKLDNHMCKLCDSKKSINAHHLRPKEDFPKWSLNLNNGITLCKKCHEKIHGFEIY